jgi:hypothetical protein
MFAIFQDNPGQALQFMGLYPNAQRAKTCLQTTHSKLGDMIFHEEDWDLQPRSLPQQAVGGKPIKAIAPNKDVFFILPFDLDSYPDHL